MVLALLPLNSWGEVENGSKPTLSLTRPASVIVRSWESAGKIWYLSARGTLGFYDPVKESLQAICHEPWGISQVFSSEGSSRIGTVSGKRIQVWDWKEQRLVLDLDPKGFEGIPALSPEGKTLGFFQTDRTSPGETKFLTLVNLDTGKVIRRYPGLEGQLFFRTSSQILVEKPDGTQSLLNLITGYYSPLESVKLNFPVKGPLGITSAEGIKKLEEKIPGIAPLVQILKFSSSQDKVILDIDGRYWSLDLEDFGLSHEQNYLEHEGIPRPLRSPQINLSAGTPFLFNSQGTLLVYGAEHHRIGITLPEDTTGRESLWETEYHTGALTSFGLSGNSRVLISSDDQGTLVFWEMEKAHPILTIKIQREEDYWTTIIQGEPSHLKNLLNESYREDLNFPQGIWKIPFMSWGSEGPNSNPRELSWESELPPQFNLPPVFGNPELSLRGLSLTKPPTLDSPGLLGGFSNSSGIYLAQNRLEGLQIIKLDGDKKLLARIILPKKCFRFLPLGTDQILVLSLAPVVSTMQEPHYKVESIILDKDLQVLQAYRSYFLLPEEPQVQISSDGAWVAFHWIQKSRTSWISNLKFFNFQDLTTWSLTIPLALDLSGRYTQSKPGLLGSNGEGQFILPLVGTQGPPRSSTQGSTLVNIDPRTRKISVRGISRLGGLDIQRVQPLSAGALLLWTSKKILLLGSDLQELSLPVSLQGTGNADSPNLWSSPEALVDQFGNLVLPGLMEGRLSLGIWNRSSQLLKIFTGPEPGAKSSSLLFLNKENSELYLGFRSWDYSFLSPLDDSLIWFSPENFGGWGSENWKMETTYQTLITSKDIILEENFPIPHMELFSDTLWNWETGSLLTVPLSTNIIESPMIIPIYEKTIHP